MRSVRLGRTFDAVLVQDAVLYLTTEADLRLTMATAFAHCRPGGVALFAPDFVRETFAPATTHGGHDGPGRALRYLAWIRDPDPADTTYVVDFAYLLHEDGRPTRSVYDRHVHGLFGRADWLRLIKEAGFRPAERPFAHSELPVGSVSVFLAFKPTLCESRLLERAIDPQLIIEPGGMWYSHQVKLDLLDVVVGLPAAPTSTGMNERATTADPARCATPAGALTER